MFETFVMPGLFFTRYGSEHWRLFNAF